MIAEVSYPPADGKCGNTLIGYAMRRRPLGRAVLPAATLLAVAASRSVALAVVTPVQVTVNARAGLATMPETGLGINHAIWDAQLGTTQTAGRLKAVGVRMLRYRGGSYGDIYHWQDHTAPGGYVAPGTDFDTFMATAWTRRCHGRPRSCGPDYPREA